MTPLRRVRVTFVVLFAVAVLAVGVLEQAAAWSPSPVTGVVVAVSAVVAVTTIALVVRILVALDRARSFVSDQLPRKHGSSSGKALRQGAPVVRADDRLSKVYGRGYTAEAGGAAALGEMGAGYGPSAGADV